MIERPFERKDLARLLELLKACLNGWHDYKYWVWKYEKNPNGSPVIWVAEDNDKIVGCYSLNPVKLRIGKFSVKGAQAVDAAVHPHYRGAGVFKRLASNALAQASREGIALTYAFPTEIAYKGQLRIGYQAMFPVPNIFKVLSLRSLFEKAEHTNVLLRNARFAGRFFPAKNLEKTNTIEPTLEIKRFEGFDARFDVFWANVCLENENLIFEKDAAYLKWRYIEHPENQYVLLVCEKEGNILGFIVVSVEREVSLVRGEKGKFVIGNIVDLLSVRSDMKTVIPALVSSANSYFQNENVDVARCWMSKCHPYYSMMQKNGFHRRYELLRRVLFHTKYKSQLIYYLNAKNVVDSALSSLPKSLRIAGS